MQAVTADRSVSGRHRTNGALLCVGAFVLLGLLAYVPQWIPFVRGLLAADLTPAITDRDFANYWMGGQLFIHGEHRILFTHEAYFAHFKEVFGANSEIRSWSYPPHFLLLLWPLGLLGYKSALLAFLSVTFALFLIAVRVFRRNLAPDSQPAVLWLAIAGYFMLMVVATQNGFLLAALLLLGLAWRTQRPLLAALAFALLTVKPQLGLLIPLLLAAERNWRVIGWTVIFTAVLVALSCPLLGADSWLAYINETLAYQRFVMTHWYGIFLAMMPTAFGSLRTLGFAPALAFQVQLLVSAVALILIAWLLWKEPDPLRRCFVVACGTFLVTPYAFNYDMGALCVIAALLVGSEHAPSARSAKIVLAAVAAVAAAVMNLGRAGLPISPLIFAAGLLVIAADVRRANGRMSVQTQSSAP